jgi:hypothetical protein
MNKRTVSRCLVGAFSSAILWAAGTAAAATYTDTVGDNNGGGADEDIIGAVITNDASNINFTIDLNTSANLASSDASYEHVELALQTGAGGYTSLSNPFGESIGISSGWNYYALGYFYTPTGGTAGTFGADLYSGTAAGYAAITSAYTTSDVVTGTPSVTISVPLATLGLSPGSTFYFDAYTTYNGGGQGAYDALDNPTYTAGTPYGGTYFTAYDSNPNGSVGGVQQQTNSQFGTAAYQYTVTSIPEPVSTALVGLVGIGLLSRRRR